jgi:hypothetical protein
MAGYLAMELAAMAVSPVHHWGDRERPAPVIR